METPAHGDEPRAGGERRGNARSTKLAAGGESGEQWTGRESVVSGGNANGPGPAAAAASGGDGVRGSNTPNQGAVAVAAAGGGSSGSSAGQPAAGLLDKRALQITLMSLMEDDRFVDMLHARYVALMRRRSNR